MNETKCFCTENFVPSLDNAKLYGCEEEKSKLCPIDSTKYVILFITEDEAIIKVKCGPNAGVSKNNSCECFQNAFEENEGDAANATKGCLSKFYKIDDDHTN